MLLFTVPLWFGIAVWVLCALARAGQRKQLAAAVKRCPDCAEMIQRDAKVCRFCGWREPDAIPPATREHWVNPNAGRTRKLFSEPLRDLPKAPIVARLPDLPPDKAFRWDRD